MDAEIEVIHGIARTGTFLKCQLKAGRSYISSETDECLRVRIESKYLQHWANSNVQIALLFYEPMSHAVYWKDIRDYIRARPTLVTGIQETKIIEFDKKLDLLTSETLPVLEQVALGNFHYGLIELEEASSEIAFGNRFSAFPMPSIWTAPTPYTERIQITEHLQQQYAFAVNDGMLYSLADVRHRQCELGGYCDKQRAMPRIVNDVKPAVVTELLNICRDLTFFKRGLDCRRDKFFFPTTLLRQPATNKYRYLSLQGKQEERTLIYVQKPEGKPERKHHAVRVSFAQENGTVFLQIDPDWHFTFPNPKLISPVERRARLISEKAGLHNKEFLYLLHFWRQYLSNNTDRIALSISSNPIFGNVEFSSSPVEYILPFRMTNDYFGPKALDQDA